MGTRLIPFPIRKILLSIIKLFPFLGFICFLDKAVYGFDCLRMRFPLTLGFETGDTEIVGMDGDAAGNLYMAGITKATELIVTGAK